ncbi:6-phospho-beta-glucosidase [Breznakia blatticola]|uniref:6-phospho-beta-glucosidase n=1 Tax=Breznakia blatticola TaxID=1754012 RepID=A0A4R8A3L6_9FIRM|nr:glycoside hydrolase family 1 protein [Breznakia blatticola]TDW25082.1 6-phospho-beta-glucosidase [Breznakia blatticola]
MHYNHDPKFPEGFFWGASSAAWQAEGATKADGRTPAIIDLNSQKKKPFADNSIAADHYNHYKEDVALMAECGFTSYRFSLAWPRIIPHSDRKVNQAGIDFYNNLIDELLQYNITPIVTLYHYDMPVWVEEKCNGWLDRSIVDEFEYYSKVCFEHFGDRVKYWLAINEQNMQICYGDWLGVSKGCDDWFKQKWIINHNMNLCSAKAVIACHEMVEGGKIGPVPGMVPIYPETCKPMDQIGAMNAEEFTEKLWNDTNVYGKYSNFLKNYWKNHDIDPGIQPGDEELMAKAKVDFIGVNCYRSNTGKYAPANAKTQDYLLNKDGVKGNLTFPVVPGEYALTSNPYVETNDWDWEIDPVSLRYTLRYLWDHYHLPMIITENGFGMHESKDADGQVHDPERIDFLRENIYQVGLAIEDGCEVLGYNPWSFTDILSTGNGMAKRYGLVYIDATDEELVNAKDSSELAMNRIKKDSFYWYSKLIKSNGRDWGKDMHQE